MIEVDYDKDKNAYQRIIDSGRLIHLDEGSLHLVGNSELVQAADFQVGTGLVFRSKCSFDATDLERITKVCTPITANAYIDTKFYIPPTAKTHRDNCKNNLLTLRFFALPKSKFPETFR